MTNIFSAATARKAVLTAAMAATAITGSLTATPAMARGHDGHGPGLAIAAGILGLIGIAAIASSHDQPREEVYTGPAYNNGYAPAYGGPAGCYEAYPGYSGYCYPGEYYTNLGWAYRGGSWYDNGGHRYARPFYNRGGYAGYGARVNGGEHYNNGQRGGYNGGGYNGGQQGGEHRDGDRR